MTIEEKVQSDLISNPTQFWANQLDKVVHIRDGYAGVSGSSVLCNKYTLLIGKNHANSTMEVCPKCLKWVKWLVDEKQKTL